MFQSTVCRRLVAVVLLIVGLLVVPVAPALAADEGEAQASQGEDSDVFQAVIDWLLDVVDSDEPEQEQELRPQIDPNG